MNYVKKVDLHNKTQKKNKKNFFVKHFDNKITQNYLNLRTGL